MKKSSIEQLINIKNQSFIDFIKKNGYTITFYIEKPRIFPYWIVKFNPLISQYEIFAGKKIDVNAFTHELLHIVEEIKGHTA